MTVRRLLCAAMLTGAALCSTAEAHAQRIDGHVGIVNPGDEFQKGCGNAHFVYGLSTRSTGPLYWTAFGEGYSQGFGSSILCFLDTPDGVDPAEVTGGLELETAIRAGAGVGATIPIGPVALGPEILGGF